MCKKLAEENKELREKLARLESAAREVLPICFAAVEFIEYHRAEWKIYLRLKELLND